MRVAECAFLHHRLKGSFLGFCRILLRDLGPHLGSSLSKQALSLISSIVETGSTFVSNLFSTNGTAICKKADQLTNLANLEVRYRSHRVGDYRTIATPHRLGCYVLKYVTMIIPVLM